MVDSIVKLLEKLVKLGEVRATNKQLYVDRYATPLYSLAETVYKDYSSLLRDVRRKIQTSRKTIPLIQFLEKRRVDQLATRLRIRATLRKTPEKNWTRFEQGILGLIHGCISDSDMYLSIYPVETVALGHTIYNIIRRIEDYHDDEPWARKDLLRAVDLQIAGLDKAWEFVCAGYADLQSTAVPDVAVPSKYVYKRSGD